MNKLAKNPLKHWNTTKYWKNWPRRRPRRRPRKNAARCGRWTTASRRSCVDAPDHGREGPMVRQGSPSFGGTVRWRDPHPRRPRRHAQSARAAERGEPVQTRRRALAYEAESEEKSALSPIFGLLSATAASRRPSPPPLSPRRRSRTARPPSCSPIPASCAASPAGPRDLNRMISASAPSTSRRPLSPSETAASSCGQGEHRGDVPGLVHDTSSTALPCSSSRSRSLRSTIRSRCSRAARRPRSSASFASLSAEVSCTRAPSSRITTRSRHSILSSRAPRSPFEMNAAAPSLLESGSRVRLLRARHPSARQGQGGRYRIAIGDDYDTLVITGPNTGGKTVSLKTLASFAHGGERSAHPGERGVRDRPVRACLRRHRRRAEHRAEPVHLLRPH